LPAPGFREKKPSKSTKLFWKSGLKWGLNLAPQWLNWLKKKMKELLEYIIAGILGKKDFKVSQDVEGDFIRLLLKVPPEDMGLVIGKGGTTIKAIRNLIRVRATLEKKGASVILQTD